MPNLAAKIATLRQALAAQGSHIPGPVSDALDDLEKEAGVSPPTARASTPEAPEPAEVPAPVGNPIGAMTQPQSRSAPK